MSEVSWPKPDLAEFHLKLLAAAQAGLADPIGIVDMQRRELLRRLRDVQRAAMDEPDHSDAGLLLEGIALRLQADLRWLEACETQLDRSREDVMNEADQALVRASGLSKEYGRGEGLVRAVGPVDVEIGRGECLAIMGPSGCGKSTLLHLTRWPRPANGGRAVAERDDASMDSPSGHSHTFAARGRLRLPGVPPDGRADGTGERGVARPCSLDAPE